MIVALTLVALAFVAILALGLSVADGLDALFVAPTADELSAGRDLTVAPTRTAMPVPTVAPTPTPTPVPIPAFLPATSAVALSGLRHEWQTWNNCGPATLAMNMGYFGLPADQAAVGATLRRNADDKNVGPDELAAYARSQGLTASVHVNGSGDLLRTLISNGIPVLIETWYEEEDGDGLGHYRLLTGYSDAGGYWVAYDTYDARDPVPSSDGYRGVRLAYGDLDPLWRVFNRTYLLIYPREQANLVMAILAHVQGESVDDTEGMWRNAHRQVLAEVALQPDDPFGWFNLGSTLLALGDAVEAANAFDRALALGLPWRMLWYQFGPFDAYWQVARYQTVIDLAEATIASGAENEELHDRRGMALAGLGRAEEARRAWELALRLNPNYLPAVQALSS